MKNGQEWNVSKIPVRTAEGPLWIDYLADMLLGFACILIGASFVERASQNRKENQRQQRRDISSSSRRHTQFPQTSTRRPSGENQNLNEQ